MPADVDNILSFYFGPRIFEAVVGKTPENFKLPKLLMLREPLFATPCFRFLFSLLVNFPFSVSEL